MLYTSHKDNVCLQIGAHIQFDAPTTDMYKYDISKSVSNILYFKTVQASFADAVFIHSRGNTLNTISIQQGILKAYTNVAYQKNSVAVIMHL